MDKKDQKIAEFTAVEGIDWVVKDNKIVLSPAYLKNNRFRFAKITATRLTGVLGKGGDLNSPVKTWASMVKIYKEDMDPMVSNVGTVLEPKIREFVQNYLKFATKKDFTYKVYVPKEVNWDVFKNENKIFGGIPDGEPLVNNQIDYSSGIPLLEIKTCSIDAFKYVKEGPVFVLKKDEQGNPIVKTPGAKKEKWLFNGKVIVPEEYQWQIGLYLYLRNQTKGLIVCYFVDTKDYKHPENITTIERDKIVGKYVVIDREAFSKEIAKAEEWYHKHIDTGISPELTEKDLIWLEEVKNQPK